MGAKNRPCSGRYRRRPRSKRDCNDTITPKILNRVPAISETVGRLWQSLILAQLNPLFADIPVESLIFEHQAEYYQALEESTRQTDSTPLIAFTLWMILDTVTAYTPQVAPQVTPPSRGAADCDKRREDPRGIASRPGPFGPQILSRALSQTGLGRRSDRNDHSG